jgi:hypothetical protein
MFFFHLCLQEHYNNRRDHIEKIRKQNNKNFTF